MFIQGKHGKIGVGFSLKNPHGKASTWYVQVWNKDTFNNEHVKAVRQAKGNNNYSKVDGWRSLGKWDDESTLVKLYRHLESIYGEQITEEDVQKQLEEKYQKHEQKRKVQLAFINFQIVQEYLKRGIQMEMSQLGDNLKEAKRKLKSLQLESL